ncbi:unnamed protein product [Effrenium voratum]|nr:unnamed protein product [Effrenium voratum]
MVSLRSRYNLDHRALLFGSRFGRGNMVNQKGQAAANLYAAAEQDALEEHNEEVTAQLASRVEELRDISLSIAEETKESVKHVEDMDGYFDRARSLLSNTQLRLRGVAEKSGSRHMCGMVLFCLLLLLALYLFASKSSAAPSAFLGNTPS